MALTKILPKFFAFGGLGLATGGLYISNISSNTKNIDTQPFVLTKNSESMFFENINPKIVLDFIKSNKNYIGLITSSTCFSLFLFKYIGFGNIMYATKNQLSKGINTLSTNISTFKNNFNIFKHNILGKIDNLQKNVEQNHENIKLTIRQKSDELKCEIKDVKSNQNKSQGMLDLMSDKINIIENQGKFISKGVWMLCNSAINNESFQQQDIEQIKQYKQFETISPEKIT